MRPSMKWLVRVPAQERLMALNSLSQAWLCRTKKQAKALLDLPLVPYPPTHYRLKVRYPIYACNCTNTAILIIPGNSPTYIRFSESCGA